MVKFTPPPLTPKEEAWMELSRRLGGLQTFTGGCGKEKSLSTLTGIRTMTPLPFVQPVFCSL